MFPKETAFQLEQPRSENLKARPEWAGLKPSALRAEQGVQILFRNGKLGLSEAPLAAEEEILAGLWRKVAPSWSEGAEG